MPPARARGSRCFPTTRSHQARSTRQLPRRVRYQHHRSCERRGCTAASAPRDLRPRSRIPSHSGDRDVGGQDRRGNEVTVTYDHDHVLCRTDLAALRRLRWSATRLWPSAACGKKASLDRSEEDTMNRRNRTLIVLLVAVVARERRDLLRLPRHQPDTRPDRSRSPRSRWRWPRRTFPPARG